jgi:8-oxo-dGTP diphosphatase
VKPVKRSVAVVIGGAGGTFLVVRRPEDPEDPLGGVWGFPAITLRDGEDETAAVIRAGRAKLGVDLLHLVDYEATITAGRPSVPQRDASMTQYAEWRFTDDPGMLGEAAGKGSLCAQIFLAEAGRQ